MLWGEYSLWVVWFNGGGGWGGGVGWGGGGGVGWGGGGGCLGGWGDIALCSPDWVLGMYLERPEIRISLFSLNYKSPCP